MNTARPAWGLVLAALLLAAGLVVASVLVIRGYERVRGLEASRLEVTGSADRVVTSDQVKWVGSYSRRVDANSLSTGYRQMSEDLDEVLSVLGEHGFDRADLS